MYITDSSVILSHTHRYQSLMIRVLMQLQSVKELTVSVLTLKQPAHLATLMKLIVMKFIELVVLVVLELVLPALSRHKKK